MKKKLISMVLLAVIMIAAASCSETNHVDPYVSDEEFALSYYPVEAHFEGGKLYVTGTFVNGSSINDIVCIDEAEIILNDIYGNEQGRAIVNRNFAKNCIIPPNGNVSYNFSCDLSDSATISSVWDVRYDVIGSYQYTQCKGANCPYCGGRANPYPNPDPVRPDDGDSRVVCPWCHGSGKCKECGGSGRNDADSPVLAAWGCALCDRTGICAKCNGTGYINY